MSVKGRKNRKASSSKIKRGKAKHRSTSEQKTHSEISKSVKKHKAAKSLSSKSISSRRLWVFRIVAITIIPVLLFLLFEGILGVAGYGFPSDFAIKTKVNDQDYYCNNAKFSSFRICIMPHHMVLYHRIQ